MNKIDILDLESVMMDNKSLMKILEDGIVTEDEIKEQSQKVIAVAAQLQDTCTE